MDDPRRGISASVAKSSTGEGAVEVTAQAIHVHGAVGFTWEADPHLLYMREAEPRAHGHQWLASSPCLGLLAGQDLSHDVGVRPEDGSFDLFTFVAGR